MAEEKKKRDGFGSKIGIIAAAAGSAIGLGNIYRHDFETKVNQAVKFLKGGDKLKVSVRFRKRTVAHPQFGEELLVKFKEAVSEVGVVDKPSKMEGRSLVMFVAPKAGK